MKTAPDGRRVFVWHGKNPAEDTSRLTEAVAEVAITELFELNGILVHLTEGQLVPVNKDVLREIIKRHIVSVRLMSRGTDWEREFYSLDFPITADPSKEPDQRVLIDMVAALQGLVAKGPSESIKLTPQQQREVQARLKIGEPKDKLAREYSVDVDVIRQLVW
jgi:hypothetical protein